MKSLRMDHLNLTVNNFEQSARWYNEIFGFEIVEQGLQRGKKWGVLRNDQALLCIYEVDDRIALDPDNKEHEKFHRIYHFGLRINDRAQWEATLKEHQLPTYFASPLRYNHSTSWYVRDPNNYSIEVCLWDNDQISF